MPGRNKPSDDAGKTGDRLNIRIDLVGGLRIGPGKVAVLEEIACCGSISATERVADVISPHLGTGGGYEYRPWIAAG